MTQTPYELLARFSNDGSVSGVSVRYLFNLNGKVIEGDPEPLSGVSDPVFSFFAQQFSAAVVAERDSLATDKQQLQGQLSALQAEKETAETNLENITQQLTEATGQIEALQAQTETLQAELAAAQARITELLEQLPFSPRVMEASAFVARIQPGELLLLLKSNDTQIQAIGSMLNEWVENDWPIVLDSPEMQQAIGYLALTGLVTQERAAELLRDCSRAEAYVADQSGEGAQLLQMSPEVIDGQ